VAGPEECKGERTVDKTEMVDLGNLMTDEMHIGRLQTLLNELEAKNATLEAELVKLQNHLKSANKHRQKLMTKNAALCKDVRVAVEEISTIENRLDSEDDYPAYFLLIHLSRIATKLEKARKKGVRDG